MDQGKKGSHPLQNWLQNYCPNTVLVDQSTRQQDSTRQSINQLDKKCTKTVYVNPTFSTKIDSLCIQTISISRTIRSSTTPNTTFEHGSVSLSKSKSIQQETVESTRQHIIWVYTSTTSSTPPLKNN
jgi:hypothetical protein